MKKVLLSGFVASIFSLSITTHAQVEKSTRTEHDLLGKKEVPADALYGIQTARALENFQISGVPMDKYPEFIDAFVLVKLAAARANAKVGALKPDRLRAI